MQGEEGKEKRDKEYESESNVMLNLVKRQTTPDVYLPLNWKCSPRCQH